MFNYFTVLCEIKTVRYELFEGSVIYKYNFINGGENCILRVLYDDSSNINYVKKTNRRHNKK